MIRRMIMAATLLCAAVTMSAQRLVQPLGRGVVAVASGESVLVSWRRLAHEEDETRYNVYVGTGGSWTRLNASPLLASNFQTTTARVPVGAEVAVSRVVGGKEGEREGSFIRRSQSLRNIYMEIAFAGGPLANADFSTKYCWPCDLDGDGEADYVVDRNSVSADRHYLEAYLRDGTYLWTVDLGPNESSSSGQDDQITAFDIDCDGHGEVIVQTSDGTRFWDKAANTWGLYVGHSTSPDTDQDGIIDYNTQNAKNPPKYMTVIDGLTGAEKASVEQRYDEAYNRTNKAQLMGDEYNKHVGHVGIFYPDGVHPALVMEWHTRTAAGAHQYRNSAFWYEGGEWRQLFMERTGGATFHQIRIGDFDGDGRDEMSSGAYCMDHDGSTLYNTGIAHGDRHRTSDIDPEHPGLETFSIQQDAPDMLGMILFDAATGEPLHKWYLSGVGDVGRGECLDLDPQHKGWEMFSTMDGYQVYSAKGEKIEGLTGYFPTEGLWWDGELDRERVDSPDGSGLNADIRDFRGGRLIEMAKESGYTLQSSPAKRGKFWGDIIGDWREELILSRVVGGVNTGIVGFTTDIPTTVSNIYCLQQDPHYAADCTTRGYYQSPNPGFYLGYDMPRPPLPPVFQPDDTTEVYGLALGDATIAPTKARAYIMPVKGQTLTASSTSQVVYKGQQGTLRLPAGLTAQRLVVSEGTVEVTGGAGTAWSAGFPACGAARSRAGKPALHAVELRARGTLRGAFTIDSLALEGALHYEGCRLMPEPTIDVQAPLTVVGTLNVTLQPEWSESQRPALRLTAPPTGEAGACIVFRFSAPLGAGTYTLLACDEPLTDALPSVKIEGLTGHSYNVKREGGELLLVVNEQREAATGVTWTGAEGQTWDYQSASWQLDGAPTEFVAGDEVTFTDQATQTTVVVPELIPAARLTLAADAKTFTFTGEGGWTGNTRLVKSGAGRVNMNLTHSDYTGTTTLLAGQTYVKSLADRGTVSSLGADGQIEIGRATLVVDNTSTSTDRLFTLLDTATIHIPAGTTALKGALTGGGRLVKTGTGQLNLNASQNAWRGGTELRAGTLAQASWDAAIPGALDATGNATLLMFDCNSSSTVPTLSNAITIQRGKTLTLRAGSRCNVQGSLAGEGTLAISFPYVRANVTTDCSRFEGTYEVTSGQLRLRKAMDWSQATLKLGAAVYAAGYKDDKTETVYTHKVGALTSAATDCQLATGTWNVGYRSENTTYAGQTLASATLNKYGDGTLTLSGTALAAPMNVYAGALMLTGMAQGTTTVRAGGTLAGTGTTAAVTVQKGGTLCVGKPTGTALATLHVGGTLTLASGATLRMRTRVTATGLARADVLDLQGTVKLTSPTLALQNCGGDYAEGQAFALTSGTPLPYSGTLTLEPATPAPGLLWDASTLATDGCLRVVADPAYDAITAPEAATPHTFYNIGGQKVSRPTQRGVYVRDGKKIIQ